ncbi:hypothetical protein Slala03_35350 [Streptomyces lavendulae subsp. lavendulae]|uniref:DUF6299 family protein n=1 Tax=Streptomyces lavendulae TaxID=1914 RepID=UPI0024A241DA|nr:DUF6299 family protein [Streptomyces lavendulae]GLV83846.1 hypothetical protein Slala03_35350 [Streptomyces lavendulae subsp. lavendulae]GLX38025.1 hypothetical protein Sros01_40980 [Streptomyces roseochromogenus]
MRTPARRMAFSAFSALAATALFAAPAAATVYQQAVVVSADAEIARDGAITLHGAYRCETPSPGGATQIRVTVAQKDSGRLSIGTGAVCDGAAHEWKVRAPQYGAGLHAGRAVATVELQEVHLHGLMPRAVDTVAADSRDIEIREQR